MLWNESISRYQIFLHWRSVILSLTTYSKSEPSISCKEKVDFFIDNYGSFTAGTTIGIIICVVLLASIILGLLVSLQKKDMSGNEPLYYEVNY